MVHKKYRMMKDNTKRFSLSRRQFVQATAAAAVGMNLPGFASSQSHPLIDNLGLQLYTVREPLVARPQQTIEAIRAAGYRQVELFDTQLLPKLHAVFKGLGIAINSSHFLPPLITSNWNPLVSMGVKPPPADYTFERVVEQAAEYGLTDLVFPYLFPEDRGGIDIYKNLAEQLSKAGEICQRSGIQLSYHNHAFEFQSMEDTSPFQLLIEGTDATLVTLEVDVFWVSVAGMDPAKFIRDHAGQVRMLHLKDKKDGLSPTFLDSSLPPDAFQPVGSGVLNFPNILRAAEAAGAKHCFVEQDHSPDPLVAIERSSTYLKGLRN
ncbi:MAG: TIM barrel protein [Tunicatimonas sp.]